MKKVNYKIIPLTHTSYSTYSIAIGNFNGFHLGHLELLDEVNIIANTSQTNSAILTFKHNNNFVQLLDEDDTIKLLKKYHISTIICIEFDNNFKSLSKDEFIEFLSEINVKNIVVGEDFHFAKNRSGNASDLANSKINTTIIQLKKYDDIKISSSQIISLLKDGNIKTANRLLNYPYHINGIVQHGLENGRKIDFRTANINFANYVIPKNGVYASKVIISEHEYIGMTYIGTHSTIDELKNPILEVNIFDFDGDLYNKKISVELHEFITDSFNFDNLDDLKNALNEYKQLTIKYFKQS